MSHSQSIKVLSYNIHKGFSTGNLKLVLDRIKAAIHSVEADIVLLQEVVGENVRHAERYDDWPRESQFEYLADTTWSHFAYGKNAVYQAGHHGNAILSKFPIISSDNVDISQNRFEKRGLLHAEIEIPNTAHRVHCYTLHLNLMQRHRQRQLDQLIATIRSQVPGTAALILGGDFNDWLRRASTSLSTAFDMHEAFRSLHGYYAKTYPAWMPMLSLDRIYVRGFKVVTANVMTGSAWTSLSDHAGLYVGLEIFKEVCT